MRRFLDDAKMTDIERLRRFRGFWRCARKITGGSERRVRVGEENRRVTNVDTRFGLAESIAFVDGAVPVVICLALQDDDR